MRMRMLHDVAAYLNQCHLPIVLIKRERMILAESTHRKSFCICHLCKFNRARVYMGRGGAFRYINPLRQEFGVLLTG